MKRLLLLVLTALLSVLVIAQPLKRVAQRIDWLAGESVSAGTAAPSKGFIKMPASLRSLAVETKAGDEIIAEQPEGTLKVYQRTGSSYFTTDGVSYNEGTQAGIFKVVFAPDGKTVYMMELVSESAGYKSWVKGQLSADGKTITVPTKQNIAWSSSIQSYAQITMLNYDAASKSFVIDEATSEVKFSVDNQTIRLLDTNKNRILGITFSADNRWALCGDFNSVYTLFDEVPVAAPENLETREYWLTCQNMDQKVVSTRVKMGFDGNNVYLQGLCSKAAPQGWIKGVKDGNNLVFPPEQYQGIYEDYYPVYFVGASAPDKELVADNLVLVYNEGTKSYSTDQYVLENVARNTLSYIGRYDNINIANLPDIDIVTEIIYDEPEGEKRIYKRSGWSFSMHFSQLYKDPQNGYIMEMVYAPDGKTVYMKDPITQAHPKTWVKGTREGNKLTFPLFQCVDYVMAQNYGVMTSVLRLDKEAGNNFIPDFSIKEVTFTVNDETGVITLDTYIDDNVIYGLTFTNSLKWNGFGDYASAYEPLKEKVTNIPEGLKREFCNLEFHEEGESDVVSVEVAIDGDKMYIASLPKMDPTSAIVGTMKDGKVTFVTDQFLGIVPEMDAVAYFGGAEYRIEREEMYPGTGIMWDVYRYTVLPELVLTYNEANRTLTAPENGSLLINGDKPTIKVLYIKACSDPKLILSESLGIEGVDAADKTIKSVVYHDMSGVRIAAPVKGVNLKTITYTDGTHRTVKVVK